MRDYAYLIKVDEYENNNKYYEMILNNDLSIDVKYGRIGVTCTNKHYESWEKDFYELKASKERRGYEDRTALHSVKGTSNALSEEMSFKKENDKEVQDLIDFLVQESREFMKTNYTVSSQEITPKMIEEATKDIQELDEIAGEKNKVGSLHRFNKKLKELFTDIPRKMNQVYFFLAETEEDFDKILERETEMLDNIKGMLVLEEKTTTEKDKTYSEAYGLSIRPVTFKEEDAIMRHLGVDYDGRKIENRYVKAFAVENLKTRKEYEEYKKEKGITQNGVRLFYHGSKVENWSSIMKMGLQLNPNASVTGKMFGQGIYFAPELRKSLNYMDVSGSRWNGGDRTKGYCAIYSVALGKCYQVNSPSSVFSEKDLPQGTHSVFASKNNPYLRLKNDEYVVYNQSACTIKYLMEMTEKHVREKEYFTDRKVLRDNIPFENLEKTNIGANVEIILEDMKPEVLKEFTEKFFEGKVPDCVNVAYDVNTDKIEITGTLKGERLNVSPEITRHDLAFVTREMKKAYAESDKEWKSFVNEKEKGEITYDRN